MAKLKILAANNQPSHDNVTILASHLDPTDTTTRQIPQQTDENIVATTIQDDDSATVRAFEAPPHMPSRVYDLPQAQRLWMYDTQNYMLTTQRNLEKFRKSLRSCMCHETRAESNLDDGVGAKEEQEPEWEKKAREMAQLEAAELAANSNTDGWGMQVNK